MSRAAQAASLSLPAQLFRDLAAIGLPIDSAQEDLQPSRHDRDDIVELRGHSRAEDPKAAANTATLTMRTPASEMLRGIIPWGDTPLVAAQSPIARRSAPNKSTRISASRDRTAANPATTRMNEQTGREPAERRGFGTGIAIR
jgi:hypothetical protein